MAQVPNEVFRLVTLRAPDVDRVIDPTATDDVVLNVLNDFSLAGRFSDQQQEVLRGTLRDLRTMTLVQLRENIPWFALLGAFDRDEAFDLPNAQVDFDGARRSVEDFSTQAAFLDAYGQLYHSWLALAIDQAMLGAAESEADRELREMHVDLLRIAHLIVAVRDGRWSVNLLRTVRQRELVFPEAWRRQPTPPAIDVDRRAGTGKVRKEIAKRAREQQKLVEEVDTIEALQRGIQMVLVKKEMAGNAINMPLDDALSEEIVAKTPGDNNAAKVALLTTHAGIALDELDMRFEHDKGDKGKQANALCASIKVFEEQIRDRLPPPNPVDAANRASIRSIDWGDLIVARETLVGYNAEEIAHIENILSGEKKTRVHERTNVTETVSETETTDVSASERDLETSDRFELQTEAANTINTQFSISAGVNTSGKYGLTKVETSANASYGQSTSVSQKTTLSTAQEIVAKSVEKTQQTVRELRRVTTTETIKEIATHEFSNQGTGDEPPPPISGIYYWVNKVHEVELRQYGKRLMVEFMVPEPGLSLIEQNQPTSDDIKKPAPFNIGPGDITVGNYLCLTKLYDAQGVSPPPPHRKQVGMSFATRVDHKRSGRNAESTTAGKIKIPDGYVPYFGAYSMAGRGTKNDGDIDEFNGHISVAGHTVLNAAADELKPSYEGTFEMSRLTETDDLGIPVAGRFAGHDDSTGTLNIQLWCWRGDELLKRWQLDTYERLRAAYEVLVERYEQQDAEQEFQDEISALLQGRPAEINRALERDELKKWSIKLMRVDHFEFDAVVGIGDNEDELQEIDAAVADEQAPVVRFFESAFEWRHMSYFLYPYYWGRREAWSLRQRVAVPSDPQHEKFLKAGSARVVVPVTPGFEARVLQYLDSDSNLSDLERIPVDENLDGEAPVGAETLWEELRFDRDQDTARGSGLLVLTDGSVQVQIHDNSWQIEPIDVGRELFIAGERYLIESIDQAANSFELNEPYSGPDDKPLSFLVGSVPYGESWRVTVPTRLVVLGEHQDKLVTSPSPAED